MGAVGAVPLASVDESSAAEDSSAPDASETTGRVLEAVAVSEGAVVDPSSDVTSADEARCVAEEPAAGVSREEVESRSEVE